MTKEAVYIAIPRSRAEIPAMVIGGVFVFAVWALHFGIFGMVGGLIWLGVALPLYAFLYFRWRGEYFVKANEEGISWRQGIISKLIYIPWNYMQRVDYLLFELNFTIKETGQVVSFATSGLEDEEATQLKEYISATISHRMEVGLA
jgi:hypothetical protein